MSQIKVPQVKLADGREMPALGLGTWQSPAGQVKQAVMDAIEGGYRLIDCAFAYQNEGEVGQGINEKIKDNSVKREDLFIVNKVWNTYHKKDRVVECCKISLKNLGLDYMDLYLIHWPFGYKEGDVVFPRDEAGNMIPSDIDFMETWEGIQECKKQGLVKSIGLSNFNSQQIDEVINHGGDPPVVLQVECHPYLNQAQLINFCKTKNIAVMGYSPLGSPARPWAKPGDPTLLEEPAIKAIAEKYGKSSAQVILRFQVQRGVIVIPKSVTKSRIMDNLNVFDFELTSNEMETMMGFNNGERFLHLTWMSAHKHYPFHIPF